MTDGDTNGMLIRFANDTKQERMVNTVHEQFIIQNYFHKLVMRSIVQNTKDIIVLWAV
jgi:hypothetical protein